MAAKRFPFVLALLFLLSACTKGGVEETKDATASDDTGEQEAAADDTPTTDSSAGDTAVENIEAIDPLTADADGDGWSIADGDCIDTDPTIHPDAVDIPNDHIDQDCVGGDVVVPVEVVVEITPGDLAWGGISITSDIGGGYAEVGYYGEVVEVSIWATPTTNIVVSGTMTTVYGYSLDTVVWESPDGGCASTIGVSAFAADGERSPCTVECDGYTGNYTCPVYW